MKQRGEKILFLGILLLALLLRFVSLGRIPSGFIPEEVSTGWNAYSLLKTGRDEWGTFLPLIFKETGGFKLALNSYLIVPVMALLGPNEFAVRIPTAIAGVLAVGLAYLFTKKLLGKTSYALASALLLAISPWHISMGRYGVDVNWGIPLFLTGLILYLKAKQNDPRLLVPAGIFFALTYYTYFNYVVFTFLFSLGILCIDWKRVFAPPWRTWTIIFILTQFIFLLPYVTQPNLTIRYSQATSVGQIGFINRINEHRQACETVHSALVCRGVYNKVTDRVIELVRRYINHYSTTVFFLYGSQLGLSGMPDRWGFFYPFEFVLLIVGFIVLLRRRLFSPYIVLWFFLYGVPSSLADEAHIWRMLNFLPLPQLIAGVGLSTLSARYLKWSVMKLGAVLVTLFFVVRFIFDYTSYFPFTQGRHSYYGFRDLYAYLATIEQNYDYIVVAPTGLQFDQLYIYYLFYMKPDPRTYQNASDVERFVNEEQWVRVKRVGKWHFESDVRNVVFGLPDHTLLVADGNFREKEPLPKKVMTAKLIHVIYYANGDPAFKILELYKNPDYQENASPEETTGI